MVSPELIAIELCMVSPELNGLILMLNSFRGLLFFGAMQYSQGFTLGLHIEPRWGSLDVIIIFRYVYGPQRGLTSEPRVLPGE